MWKDKRLGPIILIFVVGFFLFGCAARSVVEPAPQPPPDKPPLIESFDLPVPQSASDKAYLGISGTGNFPVGKIKSPFLLIEIMSFYCPYCQRAAPLVNEVYRMIETRPGLKDRIKMIGIGIGNSAFEVNQFREKYKVPFPMYADRDRSISYYIFGVMGTPTFIGLKLNEKGSHEQFFFSPGVFDDPAVFLSEVLKKAGLK